MTADASEVLQAIDRAFDVPRPAWFCDPGHCCECAEHEATLQAHSLTTLDREAVGTPAWDPITFVSHPDGFKHLMPKLARLAFGDGPAYYLDQFVAQLRHDRIATFTDDQKRALEDLLLLLAVELGEEIPESDWPELDGALQRVQASFGSGTAGGKEGARRAP